MVLICIIKEKNFDRPFLIDHNIEVFKEGLLKILEFNEEMRKKYKWVFVRNYYYLILKLIRK